MRVSITRKAESRGAVSLAALLFAALTSLPVPAAAAGSVAAVGACEGGVAAPGCPTNGASAPMRPAAATLQPAFDAAPEKFTPVSAFVKGHRITIFTPPSGDVGPAFRIARIGDYLWFTESRASRLVRFSTFGKASYASTLAGGEQPHGVTRGPDGKVWYSTFENNVGKMPLNGSVPVEYDAGFALQSNDIKTGSDGALWFPTDFHGIGRISVTGDFKFFDLPDNTVQPATITRGEDGNIWFVESDGVGVGRITPAGDIKIFSAGFNGLSARWGIAQGPDHRIWFTDQAGKRIGAIRLNGTGLTFYKTGITGSPLGMVAGPDGNLYFAEPNVIARITPAGRVTEFPIPAAIRSNRDLSAYGLAVGPDGNIWFSDSQRTRIGRLKLN